MSYREEQRWKKIDIYMYSASNRMGKGQRAGQKYKTEIFPFLKKKYIWTCNKVIFPCGKRLFEWYISCKKQVFQEYPSAGVFCLAVEEDNKGNAALCVAFLSEGCSNSGNEMALKMLKDRNRHYGLLLNVSSLEYISKPFQCAFSCDTCLMQRCLVLS